MKARAGRAAWWLLPPLVCLVLYWPALHTWFLADDFAWLGLGQEINSWRTFLAAVFEPRAQGTFRPWSERLFFLGFYEAFGLESLPFHIWVFLTQFANLALLASITWRISGSRAAGLLAALLWLANCANAQALGWTCVYNQVMCAFFLLLAFHFLLRFIETGRRRYEAAQWAAFLLGFGALELNVIYPALAVGYTWLCARKHFRRTLPLALPSAAYTVWHMYAAPIGSDPVYDMHFDGSILGTLGTYWTWSVGSSWLATPFRLAPPLVLAGVAAVSAALLGFVAWQAWRGRRLPLFCLVWFLAALAPVLPLRDHLTEYYTYIPGIGLAMLGALGLVRAWRRGTAWRAVAVLAAAVHIGLAAPQSRSVSEWLHRRGRRVERLVRSVAAAHERYPFRAILLDGVDAELFWTGVLDNPFRLYGARVFLAPGSDRRIAAKAGYGDPAEYTLPREATGRALDHDVLVVYEVEKDRLRNVTTVYSKLFQYGDSGTAPRRIDAGNPLLAYLLGPEWSGQDVNWRWMPQRATVRIGGPAGVTEKLYLRGTCAGELSSRGPVRLNVTADGAPLPPAIIAQGQTGFEFSYALPARTVGKPAIELVLEVDRAVIARDDGRRVSLAFGIIEIR